jgi:hypothetical protein
VASRTAQRGSGTGARGGACGCYCASGGRWRRTAGSAQEYEREAYRPRARAGPHAATPRRARSSARAPSLPPGECFSVPDVCRRPAPSPRHAAAAAAPARRSRATRCRADAPGTTASRWQTTVRRGWRRRAAEACGTSGRRAARRGRPMGRVASPAPRSGRARRLSRRPGGTSRTPAAYVGSLSPVSPALADALRMLYDRAARCASALTVIAARFSGGRSPAASAGARACAPGCAPRRRRLALVALTPCSARVRPAAHGVARRRRRDRWCATTSHTHTNASHDVRAWSLARAPSAPEHARRGYERVYVSDHKRVAGALDADAGQPGARRRRLVVCCGLSSRVERHPRGACSARRRSTAPTSDRRPASAAASRTAPLASGGLAGGRRRWDSAHSPTDVLRALSAASLDSAPWLHGRRCDGAPRALSPATIRRGDAIAARISRPRPRPARRDQHHGWGRTAVV